MEDPAAQDALKVLDIMQKVNTLITYVDNVGDPTDPAWIKALGYLYDIQEFLLPMLEAAHQRVGKELGATD